MRNNNKALYESIMHKVSRVIKNALNESADDEIEPVVFKKRDGEVTAYFPNQRNGRFITCYAHIGQHGEADITYAQESRPATPEEYKDLYDELTEIGYNLKVVRRLTNSRRTF